MHGRQDVFTIRDAMSLKNLSGAYRVSVPIQHLLNRVSGDVDTLSVDPLTYKIVATAICVWH
jgi:hypothetical protein